MDQYGSAGHIDNNDKALLKIFDNLNSIYTDKDNIWVVSGDNMLFRIERNKLPSFKPEVGLFIRSISDAKGLISDFQILYFGVMTIQFILILWHRDISSRIQLNISILLTRQ